MGDVQSEMGFGRIWQSGKTKQVKRMRMMMRLRKMGDEEINLRSVFGLGDSGEWK
jgi:hypothetical protein